MKNNLLPKRKRLRLQDYDYSSEGAYFVTICIENRTCLLGEVVNGEMKLNRAGEIVEGVWEKLKDRFPEIQLDEFIVMPNHFHGIILMVGVPLVGARARDSVQRAGTRPAPTLGDVIGAFKSIATVAYSHGVKEDGWIPFRGKLWQRNYYERVIRNENELSRLRQYIRENPLKWELDPENPQQILIEANS